MMTMTVKLLMVMVSGRSSTNYLLHLPRFYELGPLDVEIWPSAVSSVSRLDGSSFEAADAVSFACFYPL